MAIGMRTDHRQRIGANIIRARELADISQSNLAHVVGVSRTRVSDWEHGRHRPTDDHIEAIAFATGQRFAWFFDEHEDEGQ